LKVVDDSHKSAFDAAIPKMVPRPLMPNQMPAFHMQQTGEATFQVLLELILRHDFLAKDLAGNDDVAALIPDTPLGQAINMVVAETAEGEWEMAEQSIINSDLAANPSVGKVLNNPQYVKLLPEEGDDAAAIELKREKVKAAYSDCDEWLDGMLAYLEESKRIIETEIPRLMPKARLTPIEATCLCWIDLRAYAPTTEELSAKAKKHHVVFTGGTFFDAALGDGFLRLNFGCPHAMLREAIKRLADAMNE